MMAMQRARELGLSRLQWQRLRLESAYARPEDADSAFLMFLSEIKNSYPDTWRCVVPQVRYATPGIPAPAAAA